MGRCSLGLMVWRWTWRCGSKTGVDKVMTDMASSEPTRKENRPDKRMAGETGLREEKREREIGHCGQDRALLYESVAPCSHAAMQCAGWRCASDGDILLLGQGANGNHDGWTFLPHLLPTVDSDGGGRKGGATGRWTGLWRE
jgi:hypothetical protein